MSYFLKEMNLFSKKYKNNCDFFKALEVQRP